jgi:hypothetical protein
MTRRRLILAACVAVVAVVALGAAWWWANRLSAEERRLVGTWRCQIGSTEMKCTLALKADRYCDCTVSAEFGTRSVPGRWSSRDGKIAVDYEPNPVYRALRPVLEYVGVKVTPIVFYGTDEFPLAGAPGEQVIWTRDRGD